MKERSASKGYYSMTKVKAHDLQCPECGAPMRLRMPSGFGNVWYGCSTFPKCRGSHGAHPDGTPLGVPANAATKKARIEAHAWFDQLWKECGFSRKQAYSMLADQLGVAIIHIGEQDIEGCNKVIEASKVLLEKFRPPRGVYESV